jgi:hypothetical protein
MHQGLGDTVNALGIYRALVSNLPYSRFIVHANQTWESIIRLRNSDELRLFSQEVNLLNPDKNFFDVYKELLESIRCEIEKSKEDSYCALGPVRTADQYSQGESLFENNARMIGLHGSIRPYLPVCDEEVEKADKFLKDNNLKENAYCIMAPHTWPEKQWKKEEFELIGLRLLKEYGIRTIVVGHKKLGFLEIPESVDSFELSLQVAATLIARSAIFIGLDSGPAHIAASFDIPLIVLYFQKDKVPFDIRPNSPYSQLIVGPLFGQTEKLTAQTVFELVEYCLKKKLSPNISCPACQRAMDFVIEADIQNIRRICVCGVNRWEVRSSFSENGSRPMDEIESYNEDISDVHFMPYSDQKNASMKHWLRKEKPSSIKIHFPLSENQTEMKAFQNPIKWSFDGILQFFENEGFKVIDLLLENNILQLQFRNKRRWLKTVTIPWAGKNVRMPSVQFYLSYFQWQAWASSYQWRRMSQFAREERKFFDALRLAWVTLRFDPCSETRRFLFRNLISFICRRSLI